MGSCAKFIKDQGIDGIDIDWEYPGAPDIYVDGHPIGQKGDGIAYFKFLTVLKRQLGSDHTVSIAAPASYWYLRAFPIDKIAKVIDYIVYMTYDLHGKSPIKRLLSSFSNSNGQANGIMATSMRLIHATLANVFAATLT